MSLDIYLQGEVNLGGSKPYVVSVFEANITHNLVPMWKLAGCYDALYKRDGATAWTIVEPLKAAIHAMNQNPEKFWKLEPANKWGSYGGARNFLSEVLAACEQYPLAKIRVSD